MNGSIVLYSWCFHIKAKALTYNIYYAKILTNKNLKMHTVYTAIFVQSKFHWCCGDFTVREIYILSDTVHRKGWRLKVNLENRIIKILPSKNHKTREDYCHVCSSFSHEISSYCTRGKFLNRKKLVNLMNRNPFTNFYPPISCSFMISFSYTCNSFTNILALQNFLINGICCM